MYELPRPVSAPVRQVFAAWLRRAMQEVVERTSAFIHTRAGTYNHLQGWHLTPARATLRLDAAVLAGADVPAGVAAALTSARAARTLWRALQQAGISCISSQSQVLTS